MCMGGGGASGAMQMQQAAMQQQLAQQQSQMQAKQQAQLAEFNAAQIKSQEEDKPEPLAPIRQADDEAIAARNKSLSDNKQRNGYAATVLTGGRYGGTSDGYAKKGVPVLLGRNPKAPPATVHV